MEYEKGSPQGKPSQLRDWIDPIRLYNTWGPVGRFPFLWGLAIYPLIVIFLLLTPIIIIAETLYPGSNLSDYIGIVTYCFMLGWVAAAVAISRRRLRYLGMSQGWVWLIILPVVNLFLFAYLLIKNGPDA